MKVNTYQQCVRCVMDTSDPEIQFDEHGICSHCTLYFKRWEDLKLHRKAGSENLSATINEIKKRGKNGKYDAVLGISGGMDSCYCAYLLKQLNVRTLLVHMDNGWNSKEAIQNIMNTAKKLGFDYECVVLDWEEFKDVQLAFLRASVVEAETPTDIAILAALHQIAAKHGVKYIISGGNIRTEGILPKLWHYNAKDTKYFNYIQKKFGARKLKKFPTFSFYKEFYYKVIRGIKIIYLLNYTDYDKEKAQKVLEKEAAWKDYGGKHHESYYTKFIQSYLLPKKFQLDYRKATLSSKICSGLMTRKQAIDELKRPMYQEEEVEKQGHFIAKKLGICFEEFNCIIKQPGKYYYEYPNDEKRLNFIYGFYKKYFT
jgi:N-acetyl sugar amidotransferase